MARPGFYDENAGRSFPFLHGQESTWLDDYPEVIVDFGCVIGARGDFEVGADSVYLYSILRIGSYIEFDFRANTPWLSYFKLVFTRDRYGDDTYEIEYSEAEYVTEYSWSLPGDTLEPHCEAGDVLWEGYLVTGDLSRLDLEDGVLYTFGAYGVPTPLTVEPSLIQSLFGSYIRSIQVGNSNRTRAERLAGCRQLCWNFDHTATMHIADSCILGDVRLAEGANCKIEEDVLNNKITVNASVGRGEGEPCEEVAISSEESTPDNMSYYDGSLGCEEVMRSINGMEGPHLEIVGGQGVSVETYPAQHLIVVGVTMQDLTGCLDQELSTVLDPVEDDPDPCVCGPA
jgi:hypothetical protein